MMQERVNQYDLWSSEARRNPHRLYAQMRSETPICQLVSPVSRNTYWFFTRYDDCLNILKDSRFIKDAERVMSEEQRRFFSPRSPAEAALNRHMLNLDPPDHTR